MSSSPVELRRREFLRLGAAGVSGASMSGWLPVLAGRAAEQVSHAKACIVLWMDGGPPHTDTFDLKPDIPECGIFKPISTSVPGIQISELFPRFSQLMQHAAVIRSMSTIENEHLRARVHLRTGYRDGQGGVKWPSLGSTVSSELGEPGFPLPNFVAICDRRERSHGPGFLGTRHQPLYVHDPQKGVENLKSTVSVAQMDKRLGLLDALGNGFSREYGASLPGDHAQVYARAVQLMRSDKSQAFDLMGESAEVRARYGESKFGEACLLARRLVEAGVKLVEVSLDGWDTHFENNDAVRKLAADADPAMSGLVTDLAERGLLESTLVIWMGEFGRTPKFKKLGRDHYAKAWSTVLLGGGVRGGQVIGRTDEVGALVQERPVSVADFMATVCMLLGIDYKKEYEVEGRPVTLVEKEAHPIREVFT